jgi:hypothetical protein
MARNFLKTFAGAKTKCSRSIRLSDYRAGISPPSACGAGHHRAALSVRIGMRDNSDH